MLDAPVGEEARAAELRERCAGLFARFGIKSLNMDDLAKHLACSKKTLYKHFRDKRDLVSQALTSHLDGLEKRMDEVMSSQGNAIDAALQEMEEKRSMLSAMNPTVLFDLKKHYPKVFEATFSRRRAMVRRVVKHNVHRGMEEGLYRADLNGGCGGRFALGPWVEDMVKQAEDGTLARPLAEHFQALFTYHIRGIASPQGLAHLEQKLKDQP